MKVLVTVDTAVGFLSMGMHALCTAHVSRCNVIVLVLLVFLPAVARIFSLSVFTLRCFTRWRDVMLFLL